jgi:aconitate hydratase
VVPSLAGPKRPQDRFPLSESKKTFEGHLKDLSGDPKIVDNPRTQKVEMGGESFELKDGSVVIAAITSCTNTSNPSVMIAAGLMAKKARERGLQVKPWVKTSLAPGSKVVTEYLKQSGLLEDLDALKFNVVAYGCTTCIGNSGPLPDEIADGISKSDVVACSVLSGNRNFEGRINPHVKANYLASPPLVVAYALAGNMHFDWENDSLGEDPNGNPVYMKDLWPSQDEVRKTIHSALKPEMFSEQYSNVFEGNAAWKDLPLKEGDLYDWDEASTYVKNPPFFEGLKKEVPAVNDIEEARCLVKLGDTVTTDHISPAGAIAPDSPAGKYLQENGVKPRDFNSYGSRRGNHEVMMRGTFANIRLKNQLAPGTEGSWTTYFPNNEKTSIYDAAMKYRENKTPLIILAGKEYGTGSSRDWAAKGTALLGARAVIAESFERIHRSNLIGMGVLPLQFEQGEGHESLGLDGSEKFTITGLTGEIKPAQELQVKAVKDNGEEITFKVLSRIDTPNEAHYYKNGGILQYVLRQMA